MSCKPPEDYADPRSVAELAEPLRSRIAQVIHDAPTGGLVLVSGRRSPYQQWLIRHERCPGRECDPGCKGKPVTALPGKSKHQQGKAADMGGRELDWLIAHESAYGLARTVPSERWHFEAVGTPSVPIAPFGQPAKPRSWQTIRPGDTDQSVYAKGGPDNEVSEVQIRLAKLAARWHSPVLNPGKVDGRYGNKGQAAVVAFKRKIRSLQRLTGQAEWPNADPLVGQATIDMLRFHTP